jgi:hypothetical protein
VGMIDFWEKRETNSRMADIWKSATGKWYQWIALVITFSDPTKFTPQKGRGDNKKGEHGAYCQYLFLAYSVNLH